jgi:hypothetical protein
LSYFARKPQFSQLLFSILIPPGINFGAKK